MPELHFDSPMADSERRQRLHQGAIFLYSATKTGEEFANFADELTREAFGGLDPQTAQYHLPVERMVEILKDLKPRFIHHPESRDYVRRLLAERGCDPEKTYFDVPRMRSSTSDGYLTSGIAYAWHPHRDTWYSAPPAQINWWLPIYPLQAGNCMSVHLEHFHRPVANDSHRYDYAEWNRKHRFSASKQVGKDSRPLPRAHHEVPESTGTSLVCPVGGLLMFSGHHLHASVPNHTGRTRFSIDFRTVNAQDCEDGVGAPRDDVACTGSSIRDFRRSSDLADIPEDLAVAVERSTPVPQL